MKFLVILYILGFALFVWTFLFQILVPFIQGRPFFPIFRKKQKMLEYEIASAADDKFIEALQRNLDEVKPTANNVTTEVK